MTSQYWVKKITIISSKHRLYPVSSVIVFVVRKLSSTCVVWSPWLFPEETLSSWSLPNQQASNGFKFLPCPVCSLYSILIGIMIILVKNTEKNTRIMLKTNESIHFLTTLLISGKVYSKVVRWFVLQTYLSVTLLPIIIIFLRFENWNRL